MHPPRSWRYDMRVERAETAPFARRRALPRPRARGSARRRPSAQRSPRQTTTHDPSNASEGLQCGRRAPTERCSTAEAVCRAWGCKRGHCGSTVRRRFRTEASFRVPLEAHMHALCQLTAHTHAQFVRWARRLSRKPLRAPAAGAYTLLTPLEAADSAKEGTPRVRLAALALSTARYPHVYSHNASFEPQGSSESAFGGVAS